MTDETTAIEAGDDLGTAAASIESLLFSDEPKEQPDTPEAPESQAAPEAGDEAPEEPPASEDDNGDEPETAIEPPASWSAEARERFKQLPPELQGYLRDRESERDRGVNQRMSEIAEQRKAVEAEKAQAAQERQQYAAQLQAIVPALQQQIAGEFSDIRTAADLEKLAREDPARFTVWQAKQAALQAAQGHQWQLAEQQNAEREKALKEWTVEQEQKLLDMFPAWKNDLSAGQKEIGQVREYLVAEGIEPEQAKNLRDANLIKIARKAKLWDDAQAAKAKADTAPSPAPKVQKPGTTRPNTSADERKAVKFSTLRKTGRVEDAAAVIADML